MEKVGAVVPCHSLLFFTPFSAQNFSDNGNMNLLTFDGEETASQRAARLAQEAESKRVHDAMEALAAKSKREEQLKRIAQQQNAARTASPTRTGNGGTASGNTSQGGDLSPGRLGSTSK